MITLVGRAPHVGGLIGRGGGIRIAGGTTVPVIGSWSRPAGVLVPVAGRDGTSISIGGTVATYAGLPTLAAGDKGTLYVVQADGLGYVWSGTSWPADGGGIEIRGEKGDRGLGIDSIEVVGDILELLMTDGSVESVALPAVTAAAASALAAAGSASAASGSATAAAGSASTANTHRSAAAGSATAAAGSATAAGTSAGNAATSATGAASSATLAGQHKTAAAGSAVTALDAAAVATAAAVSVVTYTGVGSPQGVVTAPVGAIYTDTAATAGAVRWIKTSGTAATGWTVQYGDTGTRNITGSLADGTAAAIHLRRIGQTVELAIADWRPANAGTVAFLPPGTIPAGMRPPAGRAIAPVIGPNAAGRISLATNGQATMYGAIAGTVTNALGTWTTNDQWPAALPGTPA